MWTMGKYKQNLQLGYGSMKASSFKSAGSSPQDMVAMLSFVIRKALTNSLIGDIFGAVIIVVLGSSLFGTVANFSTGITIAHTGFTPNPNVTASVGFVPIIQLIPFVFGAMVLLMVYAIFEKHLPGGL